MLMLLNDACMRGFSKDHAQFFGTQRVAGIAAQPKRAKDGRARSVERPHYWRSDSRKQLHRASHDNGDPLRRDKRKLLWHQLAHHQRRVSRDADNNAKA